MTPSRQVLELVVVRFLCRPEGPTTFRVSPYAAQWARRQGVPMTDKLLAPATNEWWSYRLLANHERLIAARHEYFAELMAALVSELPAEVEHYVVHLAADEYRVLLVYAGQDVYDFFVRDHRFGPPPRGKVYRSNVRAEWSGGARRPRANQCVIALRSKIRRARGLGADVSSLEAELARREVALARGEDPMDGIRTWELGARSRAKEASVERPPFRHDWRAVAERELAADAFEPANDPVASASGLAPDMVSAVDSPVRSPLEPRDDWGLDEGGSSLTPSRDESAPEEASRDGEQLRRNDQVETETTDDVAAAPVPGGVDFSSLPDLPDWTR